MDNIRNRKQDIASIGGASLDTLHLGGEAHASIGGAGLYTALAARWAGAHPIMYAPYPEPVPASMAVARESIGWLGPRVPPTELPRFEIAHFDDGESRMINATWGAEARLDPSALPAEVRAAPLLYCGPLASPATQLEFVRGGNARGQRTASGTYFRAVSHHPEVVRQLLEEADIFFCNESEAERLFGSVEAAATAPSKLIYITLGARGVRVVQGGYHTELPGIAVPVVDPTGAGDTFCGVTLALLAQGYHPVLAARQAVACAATMIQDIGPAVLLRNPPAPSLSDARVTVNVSKVREVATLIARLPEVQPFDFTGDAFPPAGHSAAPDYFFTSTLQQFGFWSHSDGQYEQPYIAPLGGAPLKGSDFLWAAYRRWFEQDTAGLSPEGHATLDRNALVAWYRDDRGRTTMPALEEHVAVARRYGEDMVALGWSPRDILARANASPTPLATFLEQLDHVGGYKEDPLRKKSVLLAIILQQRPERFLRIEPEEQVPPIIDYHLQRSCLRTGLISVQDPDLRAALEARRLLDERDEWAVRFASFEAIREVQSQSGKSMGAVDWFFFGARRRCPEMSEPECDLCAVRPACAREKRLFQPVRRTTFY